VILVLAGTRDGREIAAGLTEAGYAVTVSVTSEYGRELAKKSAVRNWRNLSDRPASGLLSMRHIPMPSMLPAILRRRRN